jgi:hypothetical protein
MNFFLSVTLLFDSSWLHSLYSYSYVIIWDGHETSAKLQVIIHGLILSEKYISVGHNFNCLLCSYV